MKKILTITTLFCTLVCLTISAQTVTKSYLQVEDKTCTALSLSFNESEDLVTEAIKHEMEENEGKVRKDDGFIIGRHVKMKTLSDNEMDVFWKVNSTGRRKNEITTVEMTFRKMDGLYLSDSLDGDLYAKASAYLTSLPQRVQVYKKDKELNELRAQLKKVTAELADLQSSTSDQKRHYKRKSKELKKLEEKIDALQKTNN
ncbi:coiled-coil domain-containing protein [Foetidibacter luteolus]|uniref:coiled-coil domain-containing protein n=1 Tax=Foetidibacter luteolus TaxID=2608880 RepID=UPI00129AA6E8|nr:hypothetical protein [Foetidibacter luteolus]